MERKGSTVATFVAAPGVTLTRDAVGAALESAGILADLDWLHEGVAMDAFLECDARLAKPRLEDSVAGAPVDVVVQAASGRRKALLVADMDSTIIAQECIDELADLVGLRQPISQITARAMRGELEFESALAERVALLAGMKTDAIEEILRTRITPTGGARLLVQTMRRHGAYTILASGGFTLFAEPIAAALGFDEYRANRLEIAGDALAGFVAPPILGRSAKREILEEARLSRRLDVSATLAVGDGANDLDMLAAAGLGVAFHAKPKVASIAGARINHSDLTALLYVQGYRPAEFAEV